MKKKTAQEYGKEFEVDLAEMMKEAQRKVKIAYARLYDTRSAGSYLPEQPGDFIVSLNGKPFLLELKTSLKFGSLGSKRAALTELVSDNQVAAARIWSRAGAIPLFLFKEGGSSDIEIWRGEDVAEAYLTPRVPLLPEKLVAVVQIDSLISKLLSLQPINRGI